MFKKRLKVNNIYFNNYFQINIESVCKKKLIILIKAIMIMYFNLYNQ